MATLTAGRDLVEGMRLEFNLDQNCPGIVQFDEWKNGEPENQTLQPHKLGVDAKRLRVLLDPGPKSKTAISDHFQSGGIERNAARTAQSRAIRALSKAGIIVVDGDIVRLTA